jgi:Branched-chain amino acid transport system / permease component
VTGSVIAIGAVGVSLVYGILGLVNFAYGDYMAFGALVAVELKGPLGPGIVPSALLAMVATAVLSVALDLALWRPLRARRAGFMSSSSRRLGGLREIRLQAEPACGGPISDLTSRGCIHSRWSPDGKKIIFSIFTATATGEVENVYTVSADGTGLTQVTHGGVGTGRPTGARIR